MLQRTIVKENIEKLSIYPKKPKTPQMCDLVKSAPSTQDMDADKKKI